MKRKQAMRNEDRQILILGVFGLMSLGCATTKREIPSKAVLESTSKACIERICGDECKFTDCVGAHCSFVYPAFSIDYARLAGRVRNECKTESGFSHFLHGETRAEIGEALLFFKP